MGFVEGMIMFPVSPRGESPMSPVKAKSLLALCLIGGGIPAACFISAYRYEKTMQEQFELHKPDQAGCPVCNARQFDWRDHCVKPR